MDDLLPTTKKFTDQVRLTHSERKGALLLRSDHHNFSSTVKTSMWHQSKESEPKDYDISRETRPNMHKSTYNRLLNVTDGGFPQTTHQESTSQINLKSKYTERNITQQLVQEKTYDRSIDRKSNLSESNYQKALPHHDKEHGKRYLETTYGKDFTRSFESKSSDKASNAIENDSPNRRLLSQFTDTATHRRKGINIWQDISKEPIETKGKAKLHRSVIFDTSHKIY